MGDQKTDRQTNSITFLPAGRQRDRQTVKHVGRQMDTQTDKDNIQAD